VGKKDNDESGGDDKERGRGGGSPPLYPSTFSPNEAYAKI